MGVGNSVVAVDKGGVAHNVVSSGCGECNFGILLVPDEIGLFLHRIQVETPFVVGRVDAHILRIGTENAPQRGGAGNV